MLGDPEAAGAISITKVGGLATLGALVLDVLFRRRPVALSRLTHPISYLMAALAGIMVIGAVLHGSEEATRETIRYLTICFFFVVTLVLVNSEDRLRYVVLTWVFIGMVIAAYSLYQRQFGASVVSTGLVGGDSDDGWHGR